MSNKTRFFTIVLGATALAGLTYGVTRRGWQRRTVPPSLAGQTLVSSEASTPRPPEAPPLIAPAWETLGIRSTRGSTPEPLDLALSLDGIFDGQSEDGLALTVRPNIHLPPPLSGDDEEAPSADDLGLAWLMQATQSEQSLSESDLAPELENLALEEDSDESEDLGDVYDEHEDFQRTRA